MAGTKTISRELLKLALLACVLFSLVHLAEFVASRFPPYATGTCLGIPGIPLEIKIEENHPIDGYSVANVRNQVASRRGPISFQDLRVSNFQRMECQ